MEDTSVCSKIRRVAAFSFVLFLLFPACSNNPAVRQAAAADSSANLSAQNQADTVRPVIADTPFFYDSTKIYLYLTLDDGPQKGTMTCYNLLKNLGVKASFFMIGVHASSQYDMAEIGEIKKSYPQFVICNHSYTHANYNRYHSFYNHPDSALLDFEKNQQRLQIGPKIVRTPGNSSWAINGRIYSPKLTRPLCHLLDSAGYKAAGWDVEWRFKNGNVPVESVSRMVSEVRQYAASKDLFNPKHVVILAHDRMFGQPQYADSLQKFVTILKEDPRFVFETIDHYPGMNGK